jgi:hypothetical protein
VPTAGAPATASAWSGERARVLGREAQPGRGNGLLGRPMRQGFGPFFLFVLQEMFQMKFEFLQGQMRSKFVENYFVRFLLSRSVFEKYEMNFW